MQVERPLILSEIIAKLEATYQPLRVILYGSYARGEATKDSDIDLLIITPTDKRPVDRFTDVKRLLYDRSNRIPISPLVLTLGEFTRRLESGDASIKMIATEGEILYESTR
jgi:predicted nucleotidyltransferase